jgi:septation ring formation regulator EzrA
VKLFWRQTVGAKKLLRLAKTMQSLRRPVTDIPLKCTKLVMEVNHAVERFEASKKDKLSFVHLSQTFDKKLFEIKEVLVRINAVSDEGRRIEAEASLIEVPFSDVDGVSLKRDVLDGINILQNTLDQFRDKLDSVANQMDEIRDEVRLELK